MLRSASIFTFCFISFLLTTSPVIASSNNDVLSSKPIGSYSASKLTRWQHILKSHSSDINNTPSKNIQLWTEFTQTLNDQPKLRKLMKVNKWFKQFPYKQDNWVYKKQDYWASPTEFLTYGGDCEDYAIIKYMTLRKLGFAAKDMKIAMVYDVYSGTDHAFLTVQHNGAEFVLDNREKVVVGRYMKNRYKPHYAFNENRVWTYSSPTMAKAMRKNSEGKIIPGNR